MKKALLAAGVLMLLATAFALPTTPRIDAETGLPLDMPGLHQSRSPAHPPGKEVVLPAQAPAPPDEELDAIWGPDVRLTTNTVTDYTATINSHGRQVVVAPDGRVHVVWMGYTTGITTYTPQIWYKRWYPSTGWTADTMISQDMGSIGNAQQPTIACDSSGNLHVVWQQARSVTPTGSFIAYKRCTPSVGGNGGWDAATTRISMDTVLWSHQVPCVATTPNGNVHVVWYIYNATAGYMLGYRERIGVSWQTPIKVDSGTTAYWYMWQPAVAGSHDNNVHVSFYGRVGTGTYYYPYYKGRYSGTWSAWQNATGTEGYCVGGPSIAVNPRTNRVHLAWYGYGASLAIYRIMHKARMGTTASDTWQSVSDTVNGSEPYWQYGRPCISFTRNGLGHCVWYGLSASSPSYYQIRYGERAYPAGTWSAPLDLTSGNFYNYYPSVNNGGNGADSNSVHVVWSDYRNANYEIYYKKGLPPYPNDVGISNAWTMPYTSAVGEPQTINATIRNFGTATQTSIPVAYSIAGGTPVTATWTGSLPGGSTVNYSFTTTWIPAASGLTGLRVWTALGTDQDRTNDTLRDTIPVFIAGTKVGQLFNKTQFVPAGWHTQRDPTASIEWARATTSRFPSGYLPLEGAGMAEYNNFSQSGYIGSRLVSHPITLGSVGDAFTVDLWHLQTSQYSTYYDSLIIFYAINDSTSWNRIDGWRNHNATNPGWVKKTVSTGTCPAGSRVWIAFYAKSNYYHNTFIDSIRVYPAPPYHDVACQAILAPTGNVPLGTSITPQAQIKNLGNRVAPSLNVRMRIGTTYDSTVTVTNLPAGDSTVVNLPNWLAGPIGSHATRCSVIYAADQNNSNDVATGSVFVYLYDVQPLYMIAPAGNVDSGALVTPRVRVKNNGSQAATFQTRLRLPGGYNATRVFVGLPAERETTLTFANWTANFAPGGYESRCSTEYATDSVRTNDLLVDSFDIVIHDVGVQDITIPSGAIPPGSITPTATVHNFGPVRLPVSAFFQINSTPPYSENITLSDGLPPGADTSITFPNWDAVSGSYTATCSLYMAGEMKPANNVLAEDFAVGTVDVAVTAITAPVGQIDTGATVTPAATVRNNGSLLATFDAWFFIDSAGTRIYSSTRNVVGLAAGASAPVTFDVKLKPHAIGSYTTRCSVYIAFDGNPANDVMDGTFSFRGTPPQPPGWREEEPLPPGVKPVKDGGWLSFSDLGGIRKVFAARGNKQRDFYVFDADSGTWTKKADWPDGTEAKPPSKGAVGTPLTLEPNTRIFSLKGNNTLGFWSYDVRSDSWKQLADIPQGVGKKVKGGSDLVYHDGRVYCLKGITNDFLAYNPDSDSWSPLASPPGVKYDKGSWLCLDEENGKVYCHQAKTHMFYAYDIAGGTWGSALKGMPTLNSLGKKKKSKDGGSAAYYAGYLFALKGGNTQEFWKYAINGDSWTQLEDVPLTGRSGKNKKVKGGGDITRAALPGPGLAVPVDLPAMKGNGVNDFYFYNTGEVLAAALPRAEQSGVMAVTTDHRRGSVSITPNPLAAGFATLSYSLSRPGAAVVRVYDATGRAVLVRGLALGRAGSVGLDLRSLNAGVYLVKLSTDNTSVTHKLVVER